jgi:PAS domain S-box-containing protein
MEDFNLHKNHRVLIVAAIILAVLSAATTLWVFERLRFDAKEQNRVNQIITLQESLLSSLIDAENGQRGFILTADTSFLQPYKVAASNIEIQYNQLNNLVTNAYLKNILVDLKPVIDQRLNMIEQIIAYEREGKHELAIEVVKSGLGKKIMDQIRLKLTEFEHKQLQILQQSSLELQNSIKKLALAIGIMILLAIAFSLTLFAKIRRLKDEAESKLGFRNALLRSADIAIVATNPKFVILSANPASENLFGFSAENWIGTESLQQIINRLQNVVIKESEETESQLTEGNLLEILNTSLDTLRFEGSYGDDSSFGTQVSCSITKAKDNEGNLVGYILMASDTSKMHAAQNALKHSEQLYRQSTRHLKNIIDSSMDIICTIDGAGRFVEVGAASIEAWGYSPGELIGKDFMEFVYSEDRAYTNNVAGDIIKGNPTKNFHNRYISKDGQIVHMTWSAVWSQKDQLMYAIARDETESIKISEDLKVTEMLLKLAGDISKVGGWSLDLKTEKFFWTSQVYKMLEFPEDYSMSLDERLKLYTKESRLAFLKAMNNAKSESKEFDLHLKTRTYSGKVIDQRLIGHPMTNEQGEVISITGAVQEITEQKNLEQALINAKENAISANAAKDIFLSTISHEIRTPLNGLLGMLELLSYSSLNKEQKEMLLTATESGKNLVRIISDLLDHSKIEAGKLQIIDEVVSISELINHLQLTYYALASSKNLLLKKTISPDIAPFHVFDPLRLTQILGNLLSNAIKFTSSGYIEIEVHRIEQYETSEKLSFSVIDTGIGISEEAQTRLFQPFEQANINTTRIYGGTGLGLNISRKLAEMMGGKLELHSQHDQGSKFTLTIEFPVPELSSASLTNQASFTDMEYEIKSGLRLLIVDDHPVNRKVLSRQLGKLNIAVDISENGLDALNKYKTHNYDLIITDCNMPEMDGYELARQIRQVEKSKHLKRIPIIAWTANALPDARENVIQAGMDDILVKPSDLYLIKAKISQWTKVDTSLQALVEASPQDKVDHKLFDLSNLSDDPEEHQEMLRDYCQQTSEDIVSAKKACLQRMSQDLKRIAHRMKGASRLIGSDAIASLCENLELISEEKNWNLCIEHLVQIDSEMSKLRHFVQTNRSNMEEKSREV